MISILHVAWKAVSCSETAVSVSREFEKSAFQPYAGQNNEEMCAFRLHNFFEFAGAFFLFELSDASLLCLSVSIACMPCFALMESTCTAKML